jgi:DNA polymerase IIIc chi subunit
MLQTLRAYHRRLTNLTSRNRALVLLSLPSEQFLDLHTLDFLNGRPAFDLLTQVLARRDVVPLVEVLDPRYDRVNEASRRLRRLARTAAFVEAESGAQDLYVGWPFVEGQLNDGTLLRGPLLFFPVALGTQVPPARPPGTGATTEWVLRRRDEPVSFNRSLLLAYAHFNGVPMSDDWLDTSFEDFPKDPLAFRTRLYELLRESPLRLNLTSEVLTADTLQPFERLTRAELGDRTRTGELRGRPQAVLGLFPQAGSYLAPDYEALLEKAPAPPPGDDDSLLDLFAPAEVPSVPGPEREADLLTPLPVDASQEAALRRVKRGDSLVVQGPPGTGKSQLITNLIADFTARGKRVLLVCQKRAALDTVHDRLRRLGMNQFVANVHDFRADRPALYAQLAAQIEATADYQRQNASLDAILLDRRFTQEARRIDAAQRDLQTFKDALFDASGCGLSPKELYLRTRATGAQVPLDDVYAVFRFDEAGDAFFERLRRYEAYLTRLGPDHPWADRVDFGTLTLAEVPAIGAAVAAVPRTAQALAAQSQALIGRPLTLPEAEAVEREVARLEGLENALENAAQWRLLRRGVRVPVDQLDEWSRRLTALFAAPGPETTLRPDELAATTRQLNEAREAKGAALSGLVWTWFSKEKSALQALAQRNDLTLKPADLEVLSEKLRKRHALEVLLGELRAVDLVPDSSDAGTLHPLLHDARQARRAGEYLEAIRSVDLRAQLDVALVTDFQHLLRRLRELVGPIPAQHAAWQRYLTPGQIRQLLAPDARPDRWAAALQRDFDLLREADVLWAAFQSHERTAIERTRQYAPTEALSETLVHALQLAWLHALEARQPLLRGVSSLTMETLETDLQQGVATKQALSREILLMRLREQTYRRLERNRLGNVVTYRELGHQVTKRRNSWPLRRMLSEFSDEIFDLIPCWMASPESVSALFPLTPGLFDLVIFDEASQCFAEQGIPALVRGRQVVVAGDSQQLQPSELYRIRWETDGDETPDLEVDSLLDLAARYLPQVQLRGHYRSRSLDLIAFSNEHFYGHTLQLLPDFGEINRREPAIQYLRVVGTWEDQTNRPEAEQVLDLIRDLRRQEPDKSIGVVTFNFHQQALIQELLENPADPLPTLRPEQEPLFVKNIENVQGDERDIIIFSVGYAPDARGYLAMQFGSLNLAGGENRLNVAVTRARQRIYVVASIWPEQLTVEGTLNAGPKLLKAYLRFARDVSDGRYRPAPAPRTDRTLSTFLKEKLRQQDAALHAELPFADLTVKSGDRYEGLVLTDDDLYYQSVSPKEAHAYLPAGLRAKGWPFRRVWSRQYWLGTI